MLACLQREKYWDNCLFLVPNPLDLEKYSLVYSQNLFIFLFWSFTTWSCLSPLILSGATTTTLKLMHFFMANTLWDSEHYTIFGTISWIPGYGHSDVSMCISLFVDWADLHLHANGRNNMFSWSTDPFPHMSLRKAWKVSWGKEELICHTISKRQYHVDGNHVQKWQVHLWE